MNFISDIKLQKLVYSLAIAVMFSFFFTSCEDDLDEFLPEDFEVDAPVNPDDIPDLPGDGDFDWESDSVIVINPTDCDCDWEEEVPVCTEEGLFFPSSCIAECLGFTEYAECDELPPFEGGDFPDFPEYPDSIDCPDFPGFLGDGFPDGEFPGVECDCDWEDASPVCTDEGEVFPSACIAECFGVVDYADCGDFSGFPGDDFPEVPGDDFPGFPGDDFPEFPGTECDCEWEEDDRPVCTDDGEFYPNACIAECLGETDYFECEGLDGIGIYVGPAEDFPTDVFPLTTCDCDWEDISPVCNAEGYSFPNACVAECAGITDYEACD